MTDRQILSSDILRGTGVLNLVNGNICADPHDYVDAFRALSQKASDNGDQQTELAASLFAQLCQFHFQAGAKEPYGPMIEWDGKRTAIPSDFRGAQTSELSLIVPDITNDALRARIADVAWLNNRADRHSADQAVGAYLNVARAMLSGAMASRFQSDRAIPHELIDAFKRAGAIHFAVSKADIRSADLDELVSASLDRAEQALDAYGFRSLAKFALRYGVREADELATRAERLAQSALDEDPLSLRELYDFAANAFKGAGLSDRSRNCQVAAAEQMVAMAERMAASPMASSGWLMDAINAYRKIKGTKERRRELEARLREVQVDVFDEMGTISSGPIDLTELANNTLSDFEELSVGAVVGGFAEICRAPVVEDLKKEALEQAGKHPLSALLGGQGLDDEGKVLSRNPGGEARSAPSDEWFKHQIAQAEGMRRSIVVAGQIDPVRRSVTARVDISDRHFLVVASHSPFVERGFESVVASGFTALWHGDMVKAAYQLIPQLENGLRNVLKAAGSEPNQIKADLIQEDANLSAMLDRHRLALESILGADICFEIDLLFNDRAGPALRHECAHGKISANAAHAPDVVYACWLIYRLTVIPLFAQWDVLKEHLDEID